MYGVFYRPPNSDYYSLIEDSIGLAVDSGISDIIITGNFNLNVKIRNQFCKIESMCNEYNMTQCIDEPTHFTENSITTIDLLFVSNKESVLTNGVGEPYLDQTIRYHCPAFGVFNFLKPKYRNIQRTIWKYDLGNYNELRNSLTNINWNSLYDSDIDCYAEKITNAITNNANIYIPSRKVNVNPQEPPWMNCAIKKEICRRKRLYTIKQL